MTRHAKTSEKFKQAFALELGKLCARLVGLVCLGLALRLFH